MRKLPFFIYTKMSALITKLEQLKRSLETLPWVAAIDKFQHWIYTTDHNSQERRENISNRIRSGVFIIN